MERPTLSEESVFRLVKQLYGLCVTTQRRLASYDDVNIHVTTTNQADNQNIDEVCEDGYVLKILNSEDSKKVEFVDGPMCQFLVRMFEYIPGQVLTDAPSSPGLHHSVGRLTGRLDRALKGIGHSGFTAHERYWSLMEAENLTENIGALDVAKDRKVVQEMVQEFKKNVAKKYHLLQKGVIHGDFNDGNLLVKLVPGTSLENAACLQESNNSLQHIHDNNSNSLNTILNKSAGFCRLVENMVEQLCHDADTRGDVVQYEVHAVLDYGDSMDGYHIFEVAIAMMYMMEHSNIEAAVDSAGHVLAGYLRELELPQFDLSLLKECVFGRLSQRFVNGEFTHQRDPINTCCLLDAVLARPLLHKIWNIPKEELHKRWQLVLNLYPGNLRCWRHECCRKPNGYGC